MNTADVSVIIPYYQSSRTIDRTLSSVYGQTLKPKKIIIIDDCSSTNEDNEKLLNLEKRKNIKVIKLPNNKGPGNARNIGIDNADTEYIAFLDSDDVWVKNKLEIQYKFMKKNKIDISGHKSIMYSKRHSQSTNKEISYKKVNHYKFLFKNIFPTRSVMMRKDLTHRFQEDKRRSEDFLLWSQILHSDKKAYYIDKVLAYSFKEGLGEGGLTQDVKEMHKEKLDSLKILNRKGYINVFLFMIAYYFEKLKYIKRIIQQLRN